jgi:hypothetical protein
VCVSIACNFCPWQQRESLKVASKYAAKQGALPFLDAKQSKR